MSENTTYRQRVLDALRAQGRLISADDALERWIDAKRGAHDAPEPEGAATVPYVELQTVLESRPAKDWRARLNTIYGPAGLIVGIIGVVLTIIAL